MTDDFDIICSKIEEEAEFLNTVSQEIWRKPELKFKEVHAHALLTDTFEKLGFDVERHYHLETSFKAEYELKTAQEKNPGPTVAILVEYDALPEIGHACGHNLISEAGLAAAIAVKEVMSKDPSLPGKLVVLGTPAAEGGGGKIKLLEKGAFKDIDAALMVHPVMKISSAFPIGFCNLRGIIEYTGKESHAAFAPWEGLNALDAAVVCYNNISVLRQQITPDNRINVIITEGGVKTSIIPVKSRLKFSLKTATATQMLKLRSRFEMCIKGAATATACQANVRYDESNYYQNIIHNKVLVNLYKEYFVKLGMTFDEDAVFKFGLGSSDMGNVSHVVPAYHPVYSIPAKDVNHSKEFGEAANVSQVVPGQHPVYSIPAKGVNHTKEFTEAAGLPTSQKTTLAAAKAMAMTAVSLFRSPDLVKEVKAQFEVDILNEVTHC